MKAGRHIAERGGRHVARWQCRLLRPRLIGQGLRIGILGRRNSICVRRGIGCLVHLVAIQFPRIGVITAGHGHRIITVIPGIKVTTVDVIKLIGQIGDDNHPFLVLPHHGGGHRRLSPRRQSPRRQSPCRQSPRRLSPRRLSPRRLSPDQRSPRHQLSVDTPTHHTGRTAEDNSVRTPPPHIPQFDDPFAAPDATAVDVSHQDEEPGTEEPLPWLSLPDFYQMVLDVLPAGYRQVDPPPRRTVPGPNLYGVGVIVPPSKPERVLLPPSSGLLRALYLAYGAFYPVDDVSIISDPVTGAPRYVPGSQFPEEPLDNMAKHYFRMSTTDRSSAETTQFRLAPWNNVLPSVPVLDPNTRFEKVHSVNLQLGFFDTLQGLNRASQRAHSYGDLCVQATAELFNQYQRMDSDDPERPTVVRNIEMCLAQAISCNKAAFVSSSKADCNFTLVKRDAYLKSYDVPASVQKRLRAQPFHGSPYVFGGNIRTIYPNLMDDVQPTVQVTCELTPAGVLRAPKSKAAPKPRPPPKQDSSRRKSPAPPRSASPVRTQQTSQRTSRPPPSKGSRPPFRGRGGGRQK